MAGETRERIVATTAELFRRYGYTGTGLKQIVQEANAPYGSLYHFFPGGKQDLGREVITRSGQMYAELVTTVMDQTDDPLEAIALAFEGAAITLEETDYADACPIATVALEVASTNDVLRKATAEVFTDWFDGATARFQHAGLAPDAARHVAIAMLCLLEGGFLFSRSLRTTEPLRTAGAAAVEIAQTAFNASDPPNVSQAGR